MTAMMAPIGAPAWQRSTPSSTVLVQNLSKRYRIGRVSASNGRRSAVGKLASPFEYLATTLRPPSESETLWALKDVSFEVGRGEVVGIIGRNGAGKSTLLKVLSRITEPTSGRAVLSGRVGSLLEIGTGFHPELTGRENIYLSGAILGMRGAEVARKFDEIVAFAEIERFLDTPVKRYSSGMYVRLAFAVAAHLETEILLMDEVLAVGDAAFQKKCLGKMGDVATQGRTVLFVSHNLVAVQNLCSRALWLKDGVLVEQGPTPEIVKAYLSGAGQAQTARAWPDRGTEPGNDIVRIRRLAVRPTESTDDLITMATPLTIEAEYWNQVEGAHLHVCWHFLTDHQVVAFSSASIDDGQVPALAPLPQGLVRTVCQVPGQLLNEGTYRLTLLILRNGSKIAYRMDEALTFEVGDLNLRSGAWYGKEPGVVRPHLRWQTQFLGDPAR